MKVVVVGYGRSGKDSFANFLVEEGFEKYVFSDVLREIARQRGLKETKDVLMKIGDEVRKKYGARWIAEKLVENVKGEKIVFVGPRSPEEVDYLKEKFKKIVIVHVRAPFDLRAERGATRERDEDDKKKGIEEVLKMADLVVENDGTLEELREKVKAFLKDFEYIEAGMKAGLEIHQQLDTKKLFCRCPSVLREDPPDVIVERYQRPVPSEMGEFDPAALAEFKKGNKYVYEAYSDTTCLIELDEEPPRPPNEEAIRTALQVAAYLDATPVEYIHVMRKTVIDGSNTTGFQRTMLIGVNGRVKGLFGYARVPTICLEEDAARLIKKEDGKIVYRVDRLGIPLIEISTSPDLKSPADVRATAERIGLLLRATGKVKRGIGTIRQDVNVSIRGGARIEIKGIQALDLLEEYVKNEVQRQKALIEIRDYLKAKKAKIGEKREVTGIFSDTGCKFIRKVVEKGGVVLGIRLERMKGVLGREVQPGRRFGSEIADYVKVHAGLGGILHSDELPAYGVSEEEVENVKKALRCGEKDAFVLLVGDKASVEKGAEVVEQRIKQAFEGVPEETRGPNPDGTTRYMRPLPGAARMYPETDIAPQEVNYFEEIVKTLPPLPEERKAHYAKIGVPKELIEPLVRSPDVFIFDEMVERGADPSFAATLLVNKLRYWRRIGLDVGNIKEEDLVKLAVNYEKKYPKEVLDELAEALCVGKSFEEALREVGAEMLEEEEIRKIVERIVEELRKEGKARFNIVMGEAMKELKGRASGKVVSKIVKELLESP